MAGKAKFDQEAAFKSIIGAGREPEAGSQERSYYLDRDIDKALRRMALDKEKNLTETINEILRKGLSEYLVVTEKIL